MQLKRLLSITLIIVVGTFGFLKLNNRDSTPLKILAHQSETIPTRKNEESSPDNSNPSLSHESDKSNEPSFNSLEINRGLCFYTKKDKQNYIFLEVAKLLNEKRPAQILLPTAHAECLAKNEAKEFSIINYDPFLDVAYNYLGKISFKLTPDRDYRSIEEFSAANVNIGQNYGLDSSREMAIFLNNFGYGRLLDKGLTSFKVSQISQLRTKPSAVKFDLYPGIEFISLKQAIVRVGDEKATLVDLNTKATKVNLNIKTVDETFDILNDKKIISPAIVHQIIPQEKITKIPKDNEIVLFGTRGGDSRVFNLSSWFYANGYSKVSVIKGGAIDNEREISETPKYVPGLNIITLEEALRDGHNYLIIDTRRDRIKNNFTLDNSYAVPYQFPGGTSYTDPFFKNIHAGIYTIPANFSAEKQINLNRLKEILGQKSILLVPSNEYDWGPVMLGLYLSTVTRVNIYWARDGMSLLNVLNETGLLTNEKMKKYGVRDVAEGTERTEQISSSEGENKIIMISPLVKSNNELRRRSSRE